MARPKDYAAHMERLLNKVWRHHEVAMNAKVREMQAVGTSAKTGHRDRCVNNEEKLVRTLNDIEDLFREIIDAD